MFLWFLDTSTTAPYIGCVELMKQTRIVGGVLADKDDWPWMAALLRDKTDHAVEFSLQTNTFSQLHTALTNNVT